MYISRVQMDVHQTQCIQGRIQAAAAGSFSLPFELELPFPGHQCNAEQQGKVGHCVMLVLLHVIVNTTMV